MPPVVGPSTAPAQAAPVQHRAPATQPKQAPTAGISALSNTPRSLPHKPVDPKLTELRARRLIDKAIDPQGDHFKSYSNLDLAYRGASQEVRTAMRADPRFTAIVGESTRALISTFLAVNLHEEALHYLYRLAKQGHPDLAAAAVVAAAPVFEDQATFQEKAAILRNDKMGNSDWTYLQALKSYIGDSDPEANEAISRLKALVLVKPLVQPAS